MVRTHSFNRASGVTLAACVVLAGLTTSAVAELHPGSYDELRMRSAEALVIQVSSVQQTPVETGRIRVTLNVQVLAAERSESGLKPGESIVIECISLDLTQRVPHGASPTPVLEKGACYPAFLKRNATGAFFEPAAYGWSFRLTPSEGRP